jgi:hypothetical protein
MLELIAWALLALIHALPAIALVQPSLITRLYGVNPDDGSFLLLHHRAALFGVIVVMCVWAMLDPATHRLVVVSVAISMVSFLVLYWRHGSPKSLRSIATADLIGLPALFYVAWRSFGAG